MKKGFLVLSGDIRRILYYSSVCIQLIEMVLVMELPSTVGQRWLLIKSYLFEISSVASIIAAWEPPFDNQTLTKKRIIMFPFHISVILDLEYLLISWFHKMIPTKRRRRRVRRRSWCRQHNGKVNVPLYNFYFIYFFFSREENAGYYL